MLWFSLSCLGRFGLVRSAIRVPGCALFGSDFVWSQECFVLPFRLIIASAFVFLLFFSFSRRFGFDLVVLDERMGCSRIRVRLGFLSIAFQLQGPFPVCCWVGLLSSYSCLGPFTVGQTVSGLPFPCISAPASRKGSGAPSPHCGLRAPYSIVSNRKVLSTK